MSEGKSLKITAFCEDVSEGRLVPVNTGDFLEFESSIGYFKLSIDIQNFKGCSEYDETNSKYKSEIDKNLMIRIEFRPKKEINGNDLLWGNDFDSPIRDYLPYGTAMGLKVFTKFVDPSCEYDLYADKPWIYGKCLSSFNNINVSLESAEHESGNGGEDTLTWEENISKFHDENEEVDIPLNNKKRQSYFTSKENCLKYTFLPGVIYRLEFCNDYLSLKDNKLAIALPGGFEINLIDYLSKDIEKSCNFVLKKDAFGLTIKFEYV